MSGVSKREGCSISLMVVMEGGNYTGAFEGKQAAGQEKAGGEAKVQRAEKGGEPGRENSRANSPGGESSLRVKVAPESFSSRD